MKAILFIEYIYISILEVTKKKKKKKIGEKGWKWSLRRWLPAMDYGDTR